jgi:hypothetical protein
MIGTVTLREDGMDNRDQTSNKPECALAERVAAPSAKHARQKRCTDQILASKQLTDGRAIYKAKRQEMRSKLIVGGAVLAEAATQPEFRNQLHEILARRVIGPRDRKYIERGDDEEAGLLGTMTPTSVAPPSDAKFGAMAEQRLGKANSSDT